MHDWYPVRLAPRDGTPMILWIEHEEALPTYPVTVGIWETDDMMGRSHWHVFGGRFGTHTHFDQHVVDGGRCLAFSRTEVDEGRAKLGEIRTRRVQ